METEVVVRHLQPQSAVTCNPARRQGSPVESGLAPRRPREGASDVSLVSFLFNQDPLISD